MKLFAPKEYWNLKTTNPNVLDELVGGCGPGGFGDELIPDKVPPFIGTKITASCKIHDFYYSTMMPASLACKEAGDRVFLNNMLRQINEDRWFRRTKKAFAYLYYKMVKCFGAPAFWDGKNKPEEEQEV